MKTRILFSSLILALLALETAAQCNVHKKTDDFTNEKALWTDRVKIAGGGTAKAFKGKKDFDPTYRISFSILFKQGKLLIAISEDTDFGSCTPESVAFKLANGTVIQKSNRIELQAVKSSLGEEHNVLFEITKDELRQFSTSAISKVRITERMCSEHPVIDEEIGTKQAQTIQRDAACMLTEIR